LLRASASLRLGVGRPLPTGVGSSTSAGWAASFFRPNTLAD